MAATPQVPQLPAARTGSAAVELDEVKVSLYPSLSLLFQPELWSCSSGET